ncbi:MAG TPA: hypothetical protein VFZ66_27415 [Herpetosiphonaceae bacterium]
MGFSASCKNVALITVIILGLAGLSAVPARVDAVFIDEPSQVYDFETDAELREWREQSLVQRSTDYAFTGQSAVKATLPVLPGQQADFFLHWDHPFTAAQVVIHLYWPRLDQVNIAWTQICGAAEQLVCFDLPPIKRGTWNTYTLNFTEKPVGNPPQSLAQVEVNSLIFQGGLRGAVDATTTTMPIYIDAIELRSTPVETPPDAHLGLYDFEVDADMQAWQEQELVERSADYVFGGESAVKVALPVQETRQADFFLHWQQTFTAAKVFVRVYWPVASQVEIAWTQVCVDVDRGCFDLPPVKRGAWNTYTLNLSEKVVGTPPKPLTQVEVPGLVFQGRLQPATGAGSTIMPIYIDAIELLGNSDSVPTRSHPVVSSRTYEVGSDFQSYWQRNGGLPVFGFAKTPPYTDGQRMAQIYERTRLEAYPENQPPYDIQLGLLGEQRLLQLGRVWQNESGASRQRGCRFFAETQHNLCEPFLSYWRSHGLEFDGRRGKSEAESLALFGYPLTEAVPEAGADGVSRYTQWFQRVRFEDHGTQGVLLGLLGNEVFNQP